MFSTTPVMIMNSFTTTALTARTTMRKGRRRGITRAESSSSSSSNNNNNNNNRSERRKMKREQQQTNNDTSNTPVINETAAALTTTTAKTLRQTILQKPKQRKPKQLTYNDVVQNKRREFSEEEAMIATTSSSSSSSSPNIDNINLIIPKRDDVIASCTSTSTLILMLALGARFIVPKLAEANPLTLGLIKDGVDWKHACLASALAVLVTLGRVAFMSVSEDFAKETNTSNKQVLSNLSFGDVLFCAAYPALAEEMLFRGALMPALGGEALGVLVAGTVFGALHISNERKVSFALWAATVGILYGATCEYLADGDLFVPVCGHALANIYSALFWRANERQSGLQYKN